MIVITPLGLENLLVRPTFEAQTNEKFSETMFDVIVLINCLLHRFYEHFPHAVNMHMFLACVRLSFNRKQKNIEPTAFVGNANEICNHN